MQFTFRLARWARVQMVIGSNPA